MRRDPARSDCELGRQSKCNCHLPQQCKCHIVQGVVSEIVSFHDQRISVLGSHCTVEFEVFAIQMYAVESYHVICGHGLILGY